jgi:hypothetical protein
MTLIENNKKIKNGNDEQQGANIKPKLGWKKSNFKVIGFAFLIAFGLVLYVIIAYKELWLGTINRLSPFSSHKNRNQKLHHEETAQNINENSLKNGQELPRFAPDSDEEDSDVSVDTDDLSPYDKYTEGTITDKSQEIASANLINDLNDYRIYLANVNEFLQKFYKDQQYSENLDIIMRVELPKEFEEVMMLCKRYDSILAQNAPSYEQVLLFDTDIFSKFLKIRKETSSYKERKELKAKIENKIGSFIEYAFSVDLQQEFLE